jgi:hypothetical protein
MNKTKREALEKGGVFIPLIFSFAAKLEDTPLPQFLKDPTKIANAIRSVQSYYRSEGVVCYCDPLVEAEALGCELDWKTHPPGIGGYPPADADLKSRAEKIGTLGRIPTALEVVKRLNVMLRDVILMATITGPFTLGRHLGGSTAEGPNREALDLAARATLNLTRSFGEAGLDIPLFRETEFLDRTDEGMRTLQSVYSPIWNTAKFYDMHPMLFVKNVEPERVPSMFEVADCVITKNLDVLTEPAVRKVGYAVPVESLVDRSEAIRSRLERDLPRERLESGRVVLITTDDEIPLNIEKEALIKGIKTIQSYIDTIL